MSTVSTAVTGTTTLVWNGVSAFDSTVSFDASSSDVLVVVIVGPWNTITGLTYNSVALTQRQSLSDSSGSLVSIFDLDSPTTGTNNLVITDNTAQNINYAIYKLAGLDTGSPRGTGYTNSATSTSVSNVFTTVADDIIIDALTLVDTGTATVGAGQTEGLAGTAGLSGYKAYSSAETATGVSTTSSWAIAPSTLHAYAAQPYNSLASGLTLDSSPAGLKSQEQGSSVVSTPAVAPTTGNTEIKFDNDSGVAAVVDSVSGSDPYTLNYTFARTAVKLFSATGYPLYHEVAAENVTSGNIPYLPITGQTFVDLSSPVDTAGTLGEAYTGSATATGDQWVYDTNLTGDASITLTVDAQGYWLISGTPSTTSTASFYRIDSTGTVDVVDTVTFTVGGSTIPAASRTSINKIADALRALETYTHTNTNDIVYEWLESEGISRASLNGMLYVYLGGLGYTGTIDDRMKAWSNDG